MPKCNYLLHSYGDSKVRCCLEKGHKGRHKMSKEGEATRTRNLAEFMQKLLARAEKYRAEHG